MRPSGARTSGLDASYRAGVAHEPLQLRDQRLPDKLVVIRLGSNTLSDRHLGGQCERTSFRWGFFGFSVFEVPDGDYGRLARLRPFVTQRPLLFEAAGAALLEAGFPLLPTEDYPHWTVVVPTSTSEHFAKVRTLFDGPMDNPVWAGKH